MHNTYALSKCRRNTDDVVWEKAERLIFCHIYTRGCSTYLYISSLSSQLELLSDGIDVEWMDGGFLVYKSRIWSYHDV